MSNKLKNGNKARENAWQYRAMKRAAMKTENNGHRRENGVMICIHNNSVKKTNSNNNENGSCSAEEISCRRRNMKTYGI